MNANPNPKENSDLHALEELTKLFKAARLSPGKPELMVKAAIALTQYSREDEQAKQAELLKAKGLPSLEDALFQAEDNIRMSFEAGFEEHALEAAKELHLALQSPGTATLLAELLYRSESTDKTQDSLEVLLEAFAIHPRSVLLAELIGNFYLVEDDAESAIQVLQAFFKESPEIAQIYLESFLAQRRFDEAFALSNELSDHFPEHKPLLSLKGVSLLMLGRNQEAGAVFMRLINEVPNQPQHYEHLATALLMDDEPCSALGVIDHALAIFPGHPRLLSLHNDARKLCFESAKESPKPS